MSYGIADILTPTFLSAAYHKEASIVSNDPFFDFYGGDTLTD